MTDTEQHDLGKLLWDTSKVYAQSFPRQSANAHTVQASRSNRGQFVAALEAASTNEMPGYYSVYSFPRGHTSEGHIPDVDCIFIDLDITRDHYDPSAGRDSREAWATDMSALLARARMVARSILDAEREQHFRVALSGHKGIHIYLDFPTVDPGNGSLAQFKNGLAAYGRWLMQWLDDAAGGLDIDRWVDVDGSDLARLARHPYTRHHGVAYTDEPRYCVPVTVAELAELDVDEYEALTAVPRPLPDAVERVPSETAGQQVAQYVRTAADSAGSSTGEGAGKTKRKYEALNEYRETQNEDIELADVLFLTSNKPCFEAFRERDDAYAHGQQSRAMELSIMGRLLAQDVPLEVIHEFFEPIPGYREGEVGVKNTTTDILADLLARDNAYGEFNCVSIAGGIDEDGNPVRGQAPEFCLGAQCALYRRHDDIRLPADR